MNAQTDTRTFAHDARRFLLDMLAGLGLFVLAGLLMTADATAANAFQAQTIASDRLLPFSLLALVFSGLLAFNLAFFRHLRRAYAPGSRVR